MKEVEHKPVEHIPSILYKHREEIDTVLSRVLALSDPDLQTMLRYHVGLGDEHGNPVRAKHGKGLRPSLCMFACEAVGGPSDQAISAAVAIELIHNFSLIHDDIQDGDTERHNRPTVWAIWGRAKAIQSGNAMRTLADLCIQQTSNYPVAPATISMCSTLLTSAYLEMVEGQYLDLEFEGRTDIDATTYLNMISRKTGALIRCSLQLGALTGNADTKTVQAMEKCGRYLGAVFQIRDDYLGIWGYEEDTGKTPGNDIRRKKNSLPLVYALEQSASTEKEHLKAIYSQEELDDTDVASTLALLGNLGAAEYVQDLAQTHAINAIKAINEMELVPGAKEEFEELVEFLLNRQQ